MEYQVPQFIEVEDKIFGPLTLRQFIYIIGGVGISAVAFLTLPFFVALFIIVPTGIFAFLLAFYKLNNKPFIEIFEAAFNYYTNRRLYLWKKEQKRVAIEQAPQKKESPVLAKSLSAQKLHDLAWSLDIKGSTQKPDTL
jgi:hypothetical protein